MKKNATQVRKQGAQVESVVENGRTQLLRVAMQLFADRGYDGTTVRDITSAAGVSPGLIKHHFGSKAGLREAVEATFLAQFEDFLSADLPEVRLLNPDVTVKWYDQWIESRGDTWDLAVRYIRRALLEGNEWGASVFDRFFRIVRHGLDILDAQGKIRPDMDRLWLPLHVVYLCLGTMLLDPYVERVVGRSGFDKDLWHRRYRAYMDLLWHGISPAAKQHP